MFTILWIIVSFIGGVTFTLWVMKAPKNQSSNDSREKLLEERRYWREVTAVILGSIPPFIHGNQLSEKLAFLKKMLAEPQANVLDQNEVNAFLTHVEQRVGFWQELLQVRKLLRSGLKQKNYVAQKTALILIKEIMKKSAFKVSFSDVGITPDEMLILEESHSPEHSPVVAEIAA